MTEAHSYLTILKASEGIFKDRGSKFMAYAYPVSSEEEIAQHLANLRKEHLSARHHCYAWRLDPRQNISRANDDGEPSNSAGKPIMTQITSNNLHHVLIVVVRYFGGTLLGVSGLINAYRSAAAAAIANTRAVEHFFMNDYRISFGTEDLSLVMRILREGGAKILSQDYGQHYEIVFRIKTQLAAQAESSLNRLYKTKLELLKTN